MAAEYSANVLQNVLPNANVIFQSTPVPDTTGYIFHRDESGIFRLASPSKIRGNSGWNVRRCCCRKMPEALYEVTFQGNIAVPTGATVGEIQLGIAIDGAVDPSSIMSATPAAVGNFNSVSASIIVAVPAICGCESVSIVNPGETAVDLRNANLLIEFLRIQY